MSLGRQTMHMPFFFFFTPIESDVIIILKSPHERLWISPSPYVFIYFISFHLDCNAYAVIILQAYLFWGKSKHLCLGFSPDMPKYIYMHFMSWQIPSKKCISFVSSLAANC